MSTKEKRRLQIVRDAAVQRAAQKLVGAIFDPSTSAVRYINGEVVLAEEEIAKLADESFASFGMISNSGVVKVTKLMLGSVLEVLENNYPSTEPDKSDSPGGSYAV